MSVYVLESTSSEKIPVIIYTSADPIANNPTFAITTSNTEPTGFQTGEWQGSWNNATGAINALTPLAGQGQTLDATPGTDYYLWARWIIGTETPTVQAQGTIRVT